MGDALYRNCIQGRRASKGLYLLVVSIYRHTWKNTTSLSDVAFPKSSPPYIHIVHYTHNKYEFGKIQINQIFILILTIIYACKTSLVYDWLREFGYSILCWTDRILLIYNSSRYIWKCFKSSFQNAQPRVIFTSKNNIHYSLL